MSPIMKLFILLLLTLLINNVKPNHGPNRDSTNENDDDFDETTNYDIDDDDDDDVDDGNDDENNDFIEVGDVDSFILERVAELQMAANNDPNYYNTEAFYAEINNFFGLPGRGTIDNRDERRGTFDNRDERRGTFDNRDERRDTFDNTDEIPTFPWGNRVAGETSFSDNDNDNDEEVPYYPWPINRGGIGRNTYNETEAEIILQVLNENGYAVSYDSDSIARFLNENEDFIHNQPEFQTIVDRLSSTLGAEYRSNVRLMVRELRNVTRMRGYWTTGTAFSNAIENCDNDYLERLVHAVVNHTMPNI